VEELSITPGGFSKTTAFFTLVLPSGERQALVLRKDLPLEFVSSVVYELPLLQRLHAIGFPVAEPVWLEDDPSIVGGCFMVSRRAAGSVDFQEWAGDKDSVKRFARQLAKVMADLHALDPSQLGFGPAVKERSAGHFLLDQIDRWYQVLVKERIEPHLPAEMVLEWLRANVPRSVFERRASFVHGDIGFHNMVIDRGQVTALLDWEFSHVADPIVDLIYTKTFIEKVMDWEEFKSFYYEYGGPVCTPEEEAYYTIWSKIRVSIPGVRCAHIFANHLPDELKFAAAGFVLARYLELDAADLVLEALKKAAAERA
jgi:aminoglycoside phosphotransferase (APT) family kinase protein